MLKYTKKKREKLNLNEVKWNWNGTNYTLMNNSLVLFMNFDNVSSLEENSKNKSKKHIEDFQNNRFK